VGNRGDDLLRAVGNAIRDLEDPAGQGRIVADNLSEAIGSGESSGQTENFLAGFLQGW
jgi:hypothetical protein